MNLTNNDFLAIEKALALLPHGEDLVNLCKKKKANNKRIADYIAEKRKTNKNYARKGR